MFNQPKSRNLLRALGLAAVVLCTQACAAQPHVLATCPASIRAVFERASPAVVRITGQSINPYRREERVSHRLGSGFLFDENGLILTNSHVVYGLQTLVVTLDDGTIRRARLVGADPFFDLAVIQIDRGNKGALPVLKLGDSDQLRPGDEVIAIGNPLGLDQTVTRGIVSGVNRNLPETPLSLMEPLIQIDAAINPGNSGGPLLDACGDVVGVNTAIISGAQNIGFSIPINLARTWIPSLIKNGRIIRPWIGFHGQVVDPEVRNLLRKPMVEGLLVEVVEPGSPAEHAGIHGGDVELTVGQNSLLLGGDIVVSINGTRIASDEDLSTIMRGLKVGSKIKLKLYSDGHYREVSYALPERPLLPGDLQSSDNSSVAPLEMQRFMRRPGH